MHTGLAFQIAKNIFTLDKQVGTFDARLFAVDNVENLVFEPPAVGPVRVHAQKHLRPVLRLGTACAGMKGHNGIVFVILAGQQSGQRLVLELLAKSLKIALNFRQLGLIAHFLRHFNQCQRVLKKRFQFVIPLGLSLQLLDALQNPLTVLRVIPKIGGCRLFFQLRRLGQSAVQVERRTQLRKLRTHVVQAVSDFVILYHSIVAPFIKLHKKKTHQLCCLIIISQKSLLVKRPVAYKHTNVLTHYQ